MMQSCYTMSQNSAAALLRNLIASLSAKLIVRPIVLLIKIYRYLSPLFPAHCRFYPSCSAYALEALTTHGAIKGGWLAIKRLLRCQPFSAGGLDPVPPLKPCARMKGYETADQ